MSYLEVARGVRDWRACVAMAVNRLTVRYRSNRPDDTERGDQLKQLASECRRLGYRNTHVPLACEEI